MFVHDLLSLLQSVLTFWLGHLQFISIKILLLLGVLVLPQVQNITISSSPLIHGKGRRELSVRSDLNAVEEIAGEVLAVIADEVVGRSLFSHIVDGHLA